MTGLVSAVQPESVASGTAQAARMRAMLSTTAWRTSPSAPDPIEPVRAEWKRRKRSRGRCLFLKLYGRS